MKQIRQNIFKDSNCDGSVTIEMPSIVEYIFLGFLL